MRYLDYLKKLIACKSVTPSDGGAMEYIKTLLQEHGFYVDVQVFGEENYRVLNLYAEYTANNMLPKGPNLCFAGHVDVVPAGEDNLWQSDPFVMRCDGDKIYGRGAVDMKGAIACMLAASFEYLKANPNFGGAISFLLTSDEEGKAQHGTRAMLEYLQKRGKNIDFAVLGEPTCGAEVGDTIKIGRRGSINFTLKINGTQGHVAYPELANNPVHCLVKVLHDLTHTSLDDGSKFFPPSNLEITSIDVNNNVTNVIPKSAEAKFNIRFNDLHSSESIVKLVRQRIEKYAPDYELKSQVSANSFIQEPTKWFADLALVVEEQTGFKPEFRTNGGTSDARFIKDYCQVAEFGLLSEFAHKINENTKNSDLQRLHNVYYYFLSKFFASF